MTQRYRIDGVKLYQGNTLIATAASPEHARTLLQRLNGDDGYLNRVYRRLTA